MSLPAQDNLLPKFLNKKLKSELPVTKQWLLFLHDRLLHLFHIFMKWYDVSRE